MSKRSLTWSFFVALVVLYASLFSHVDRVKEQGEHDLQPLAPKAFYDATGYLKQLSAEIVFIKTKLFLGSDPNADRRQKNMPVLSAYFKQVAVMHPLLSDTYYMAESALSWVSPEYAARANDILKIGIQSHQDVYLFPFFMGFNYFYHLHEPEEGAKWLKRASEYEGAPKWFAHFASILAARGGNISGGLAWLRMMLSTADDENEKKRYVADIAEYEKAMLVLKAIERYKAKLKRAPEKLEDLVPEFLDALPAMTGRFSLDYKQGKLFLR